MKAKLSIYNYITRKCTIPKISASGLAREGNLIYVLIFGSYLGVRIREVLHWYETVKNKTGLRKTVRSREMSGLGSVSGPGVSMYTLSYAGALNGQLAAYDLVNSLRMFPATALNEPRLWKLILCIVPKLFQIKQQSKNEHKRAL